MVSVTAVRHGVGVGAARVNGARLAVAAAVIAPVLFLAGQALLPKLVDTFPGAFDGMVANRDQLMAARLLTAAGAFLFVAAIPALLVLIGPGTPGARLLRVGAVVFGVSTFSNAVSQAVEGYATQAATAPGVSYDTGLTVMRHLGEGAVALPIGFWSIPVFALGLLLMAAALLRSRQLPVWLPVLLIIGTLLAAAMAGRGPVVALTQLPFTVAFAALGVTACRRGYGRRTGQ